MTSTIRMRTSLAVVAIATVSFLAAGCGSSSSSSSAPHLSDPAATARELVTTYLSTLQSGESVADLIAPNFELQRSNGKGSNREQYLADPAVIHDFVIGDDLVAAQSGDTLSVRWSVRVSEETGGASFSNVTAPRLTVFEWVDGSWKIVGYGNFNQIPG